jgi:hypothetical protein
MQSSFAPFSFSPSSSFFGLQASFVFRHPAAANSFIRFFDSRTALREAMQQDRRAILVKEIENPVARLSHPQPNFAEPSLDLRSVGIIECRAALSQQIDASNDLTSNILREAFQPTPDRKSSVSLPIEIDLPRASQLVTQKASLSNLISRGDCTGAPDKKEDADPGNHCEAILPPRIAFGGCSGGCSF